MAGVGTELADAFERVLPAWVTRCVRRRVGDERLDAQSAEAGRAAVEELMPRFREVVTAGIDERRGNPLALLRKAVLYPTAVLLAAGVAPVVRSPDDERRFPDDIYGLVPAHWSDVDESLADPGLRWSVSVAWAARERHRPGPSAS